MTREERWKSIKLSKQKVDKSKQLQKIELSSEQRIENFPKISCFNEYSSKSQFRKPLRIRGVVEIVELIRTYIPTSDTKGNFNLIKFVTWSGKFGFSRNEKNIENHTGMICLTIRFFNQQELLRLTTFLLGDPYTRVLFVDNIEKVLKLVVKIDVRSPSEHTSGYNQLRSYFSYRYKLTMDYFDDNGKKVTDLCQLPHDPSVFHNPSSASFRLIFSSDSLSDEMMYGGKVAIEVPVDKSKLFQQEFEAALVGILLNGELEQGEVKRQLMEVLNRGDKTVRNKMGESIKKEIISCGNTNYKIVKSTSGKKHFLSLLKND